jgi:hypothetical protein
MKLAYIISAYKYPDQLIRLIGRLATGDAQFLVHVDKRTDSAAYRTMVTGAERVASVRFLKRHTSYWGGFGHVAATLEGISELVRNEVEYDYAILLTGQDYPIKSNSHIQRFLRARRGQLFLEYFPLPHPEWQHQGMDRIEGWHWHVRGRYYRLTPGPRFPFKRKIPHGLRPFGGSSYWCLTRDSLEFVDRWTADHPRYVEFFKRVEVPDELFFQTIILNSPFRERVQNDNLRHVEWRDPESASPAILGAADFPTLAQSPKLFARKFDMTVDAGVLDLIDRHLLARSPADTMAAAP